MGMHVISLSDVGEGVAEAELIEWHVAVGDTVGEDQLLGVVMTDKAAVDVPSSVLGKVVKLCVDVGEIVAVGADLIHLEVSGEGNANVNNNKSGSAPNANPNTYADKEIDSESADVSGTSASSSAIETSQSSLPVENKNSQEQTPATNSEQPNRSARPASNEPLSTNISSTKVLAAPSVRQRARDLDVDISTVSGSGPAGRIVHADLDRYTERRSQPGNAVRQANTDINVVKIVGMRRKIAEKMALANTRIPHITVVEEIDVHYLEELRAELNEKHTDTRGKLTILPFIMKSIVEAAREQPELNARYDDEAGTVAQYGGVHIGIATQTKNGLVVPVVKHTEINSLWKNASEVKRLSDACRDGKIERDDLTGSTITISSLGPLGAVATTPIINHPEVAIVGINKMMIRPFWDGQQFVPRKMMNISCSFDHRVVDGWDAAVFVQKLKSLLEKPAMLFLEN